MQRALFIVIGGFALLMLGSGEARAQASEVSELWREWAVLERQQRVEAAELLIDRQRHRARREAREAARETTPKRRDKAPGR